MRLGDQVEALRFWPYQDGFNVFLGDQGRVTSILLDGDGVGVWVIWPGDAKRVERIMHPEFLRVVNGLDVMLELLP